jgi:hypothetical protein
MRWFRSNRCFGGCLALFALWLQLIVSFAHVHPQYASSWTGASPRSLVSAALTSDEGKAALAAPFKHPGQRAPHDNCLICATVSLLSAGQAVEPPALAVPVIFKAAHLETVAQFGFETPRIAFFQTRAPPIA